MVSQKEIGKFLQKLEDMNIFINNVSIDAAYGFADINARILFKTI